MKIEGASAIHQSNIPVSKFVVYSIFLVRRGNSLLHNPTFHI